MKISVLEPVTQNNRPEETYRSYGLRKMNDAECDELLKRPEAFSDISQVGEKAKKE